MNTELIKSVLLKIYGKYRLAQTYRRYKSSVIIKKLTKKQKRAAKEYYQKEFGIRISTKYHELIYSKCGVFKPEFMPFDSYSRLIEKFSPFCYKKVLDDKVLYDWFLSNVRIPERVLSCCNGVYYKKLNIVNEGGEISKSEALVIASNLENCIIKPSKDSSAGIGVRLLNVSNGIVTDTSETLDQILNSYHGNFVIEKKIINNENLRALNPSSCNTLRVHTWRNRDTGKIVFVSSFLRVGRKGSLVDNGFAGGFAVPIDNNGFLSNSACTLKHYKRYEQSDTGITFKGYKIEHFDEIVDLTQRAHHNLPHFDFVGWDVTVDKDENVVIIEFNPDPDMRLDQLIFLDTCLLGHQKDILKEVYKNDKNSYSR